MEAETEAAKGEGAMGEGAMEEEVGAVADLEGGLAAVGAVEEKVGG